MTEQTTKRYPDIRGWLKETYPQYYPLSRRAESGEWVSDFYKEDRPFILAGMRCAAMRWEVQKFYDGLGMGRGVQVLGFIPDDVSEADLNRVFEAALADTPFRIRLVSAPKCVPSVVVYRREAAGTCQSGHIGQTRECGISCAPRQAGVEVRDIPRA